MKKLTTLSLGLTIVLVTGCATTSTKHKTSKESEAYLKGVHSQMLDPTVKKSQPQCVVTSNITEEKWPALVQLANACVAAKNFRQVERYGNHLAKFHHMGPWGAYFLSLAAENNGDLDRALWMVELALKKTPAEGLLIYQKARIVWQAEDFQQAVQLLEQAVALRPDLVGGRLLLGQLYYRDHDFDKAKKHFKAVVDMDSNKTSAWVGLAECELEVENGEAALNALEKAMDLDSNNIDYQMREAYIYEKTLKDPRKALSVYKKIYNRRSRLKLSQNVTQEIAQKMDQLKNQLAKQTPGEQVSQRAPAKQEGVSK